ncbi:unnamed protein product, partial [Laminaria digitata]
KNEVSQCSGSAAFWRYKTLLHCCCTAPGCRESRILRVCWSGAANSNPVSCSPLTLRCRRAFGVLTSDAAVKASARTTSKVVLTDKCWLSSLFQPVGVYR